MGTTYRGIYIPSISETGWGTLVNNNWTLLADARLTGRSVTLVAATGTNSGGVVGGSNVGGSQPTGVQGHVLADATTSGVHWAFQSPQDVAIGGSSLLVRPLWGPDVNVAGASTVRWSLDMKVLTGASPTAYHLTNPVGEWTGASVTGRTANTPYLEPGFTPGSFTVAAGQWVRLNLQRFGTHAADTVTANVELLGVQVDYSSVG